MRVLITGSAGFIGREQVKAALAAGHEVRTIDRAAGSRKNDWEHIPGDLRDLTTVRRAVQGVDAVIHLGAIANDRHGHAEEVLTVNVQGTWNILLACVEADVDRVVYYSSVNSLGNFMGHRASDYLPIDDTYPRHPMSPYQLSKHLGEECCRSFSAKNGITTICLRPVYVADPDHYSRWREHRKHSHSDEWGRRDYWSYVDVRDVCSAALLGLEVQGVSHDAFLLTADDATSDTPTAERVKCHYPDTPWKQDQEAWLAERPLRSLVDCSHAKSVLGWQPRYSWQDAPPPEVAEA